MAETLTHHGIKGMRWGVRRTPEQLGHVEGDKKAGFWNRKTTEDSEKKPKNLSEMSDAELQKRINRLNMEETYEKLLAREKERHTGPIKKALGDAFAQLGKGLMDKAITTTLNRMFNDNPNDKKKFDIDDWKDADVNDMSSDVIAKVSTWYKNAKQITDARNEQQESKDSKTAAPKTSAPKTSAPKTAAPKTAAPKTAAPKTSAPKTSAPKTSAPKTSAPKTSAPKPNYRISFPKIKRKPKYISYEIKFDSNTKK